MTALADLLRVVNDLANLASKVIEESRRITLEGPAFDTSISFGITRVIDAANALGLDGPVILISESTVTPDDLADGPFDGEGWRLILAKTSLAEQLQARDNENTLMFFSVKGFHQWLGTIDPFAYPSGSEPDFCNPTTIRVYGLTQGIGGPSLWVLPIDADAPELPTTAIPSSAAVQGLIHVNTTDRSFRVCPNGFALTWGCQDQTAAAPLLRMSGLVVSACLVQELTRVNDNYEVTLRGTKRISLPLAGPKELVTPATLAMLIQTVSWVYEERAETRLRLVTDRLSIDSDPEDTFLSSLGANLEAALQQARDSYTFVILERKDAYFKEMRELMKDLKSQADLYAAKVRDLVGSLTRDVLGVLVFISFSFIGKFDHKNLMALLASDELSLLVKFLAGYLVLSGALQLLTNWRDAKLSYNESEKWLDFLQNYTSRKERKEGFLSLLQKRRTTLYFAMWISGFSYCFLGILTWNLPSLIQRLLV